LALELLNSYAGAVGCSRELWLGPRGAEDCTKLFRRRLTVTLQERQKAFDLLDALTKSGGLAVKEAELHVVVASTHCFGKTLMNTIIQVRERRCVAGGTDFSRQDNQNPIEKLEKTSLIIASSIHGTTPQALIKEEHISRVAEFHPALLEQKASSRALKEKEKQKEKVDKKDK
jgi:hypothetical protein